MVARGSQQAHVLSIWIFETHLRAERDGRGGLSQGHAGDPHVNGRDRELDDGRLARSEEPAESAAGWLTAERLGHAFDATGKGGPYI